MKTAMPAATGKTRRVDATGRLDLLGLRVFNRLLDLHGNPALKVAMKAIENDVTELFTETLGPRSRAGKLAKRIVTAAADVEREQLSRGGLNAGKS